MTQSVKSKLSANVPGPGRDGCRLELNARARVNDNPKQADQWALFDVSHPIEKMRWKGSLGSEQIVADRRYRAACVWQKFFYKCQGLTTTREWLQEHVDGTGDPHAAPAARMDASMQRLNVMEQVGMTRRRFEDLDSICGLGLTVSEQGRATSRHPSSVRESFLSALDVVGGFPEWDREMERVGVLYLTGAETN
ncbi:MAG: hypothetical protein P8P99_08540 [Maricaulis sp.]|jgi:hypothetical protein|nr:hypothetical protein [Maricaulis sp.]